MPPVKKVQNSGRRRGAKTSRGPSSGRKARFFPELKRTLAGLAIIIPLLGGGWFIWSGGFTRMIENIGIQAIHLARHMGLGIDGIIVEGQRYSNSVTIQAAIGVGRGDLIFYAQPQAIRQRLEEMPWIRSAVVQRKWPSSLHVRLIEQYPIALWQKGGRYFLIDDLGHVLERGSYQEFAGLPVLTGDTAPREAPALLDVLNKFPVVYRQVTGATLVGGRRWDLVINDKITVKLPEEEIQDELEYLSGILASGELEERNIISIDLRTSDRAYFYMGDSMTKQKKQAHEGKKTSSREKM